MLRPRYYGIGELDTGDRPRAVKKTLVAMKAPLVIIFVEDDEIPTIEIIETMVKEAGVLLESAPGRVVTKTEKIERGCVIKIFVI